MDSAETASDRSAGADRLEQVEIGREAKKQLVDKSAGIRRKNMGTLKRCSH